MESDAERQAVRLVVVMLRHLIGDSQREAGAISGVDQRRWSRYETGQVMPRRPILEKFSGIAGVSASRLDQLLTLLCQICEESAAQRTAPRGGIEPSESDESQRLRQMALDLVEKLGPMIFEAVAELEAFADSLVPSESVRRQ